MTRPNTLFELTLFDPDKTLVSLLEQHAIAFRQVAATHKFVVAMDEVIDVLGTNDNEALIQRLAIIFTGWLKGNGGRKLQVQLVDGSTVYIDEGNTEGAVDILNTCLKASAFDPEYNNRILSKK